MSQFKLGRSRRTAGRWVAPIALVAMLAIGCRAGAPVIKTEAVSVDGTIAGIVHASDNAIALAGRTVTAVNVENGARYETATGTNGGYTMKVPEGKYRLEVETRNGERLSRRPGETSVRSGDLDAGRDFDVVVTTTAHP